jgi:hypothetical protein
VAVTQQSSACYRHRRRPSSLKPLLWPPSASPGQGPAGYLLDGICPQWLSPPLGSGSSGGVKVSIREPSLLVPDAYDDDCEHRQDEHYRAADHEIKDLQHQLLLPLPTRRARTRPQRESARASASVRLVRTEVAEGSAYADEATAAELVRLAWDRTT